MNQTRQCPKCGAALPADAPSGLCPECLMALGMTSSSTATSVAREAGETPGRQPAPALADLARHFPHLEILELLGVGGMGAVYKARQRGLDRLVALKILPPSISENPSFAERFSREARALARLNHPHIVAIHDSGVAGGFYYFLMEFVDGVNLRRMMHTGHLEPREALALVPQICDALQYAHDEGIVHRDIKPENILIDKKGRVKIADFGLVKLLQRSPDDFTLTAPRQVMGTPHYMAPEQLEKPQTVDHRVDIYSLGVVFYEMLTGELPLGRFQPPSKKVQVDVRLDEVVLRSLEKEPDRRYQHANDLKTQVQTITNEGESLVPVRPRQAWHGVTVLGVAMVFSTVLAGLAIALAVAGIVYVPRLEIFGGYLGALAVGAIVGLVALVVTWHLFRRLSADLLSQTRWTGLDSAFVLYVVGGLSFMGLAGLILVTSRRGSSDQAVSTVMVIVAGIVTLHGFLLFAARGAAYSAARRRIVSQSGSAHAAEPITARDVTNPRQSPGALVIHLGLLLGGLTMVVGFAVLLYGKTLHWGQEIFVSWLACGAALLIGGAAVFFGCLDRSRQARPGGWTRETWLMAWYTILGAFILVAATQMTQDRPLTEILWLVGTFVLLSGGLVLLGDAAVRGWHHRRQV